MFAKPSQSCAIALCAGTACNQIVLAPRTCPCRLCTTKTECRLHAQPSRNCWTCCYHCHVARVMPVPTGAQTNNQDFSMTDMQIPHAARDKRWCSCAVHDL